MANQEQVALLRQGREQWNAWRRVHPEIQQPDLRNVDLREADLRNADLRGADLRGTDLRGADLSFADLRNANLIGAKLGSADLRFAYLGGVHLDGPWAETAQRTASSQVQQSIQAPTTQNNPAHTPVPPNHGSFQSPRDKNSFTLRLNRAKPIVIFFFFIGILAIVNSLISNPIDFTHFIIGILLCIAGLMSLYFVRV